jgi:Na+/melibiose symporter-like transporter
LSHPLRLVATDPALRLVAMAIVLTGALAASIAPYFSLLAIETFGFSNAGYSALLALSAGVNVTASISIGILTDQRGRRRRTAMAAATAILTGGLLVWAAPGQVTFALTHAIIWPVGFTLMGQLFALARLAAPSGNPALRDGVLATVRAFFAVPFVAVLC